ncbi:MAG: YciI family protein [Burkholderiaceae bacterium]
MFIIFLTYLKPFEEIDAVLPAHREFLREQYAKGLFLMSGRMVPRIGGVIIAASGSRAAIEALVQLDPFHRAGIARYDITEFVPTMTSDLFESLRQD